MESDQENSLQHYGTPRRSGRYPWGSGIDPQQHSRAFKSHVDELRTQGLSNTEIAKSLGIKTPKLRAAIQQSSEQIRAENRSVATRLDAKGMGATAIGKQMGINESSVRSLLSAPENIKKSTVRNTADAIVEQAKNKPFLDVGAGNEHYLGVTKTTFRNAVSLLEEEGHTVHPIKTQQLGVPGKFTPLKVLTKNDVTWHEARDAVLNKGLLANIASHSKDGGLTFNHPTIEPMSLESKRVTVRYGKEGAKQDGLIELRRGVADLNLEGSRYGQVRIAVDGTHFMKGMAVYADDLPKGIDVRYNSAKDASVGKLGAMKPLKLGKEDAGNRFGASTYPHTYTDKNGKEHMSALNIVGTAGHGNVEGRWEEWSNTISSQMLSKQSVGLASTQLGKARASTEKDLSDILKLTNPVVKEKLLTEFADNADSAASHLKAAAFPRQSTHVLLPMNTVRPTEIYAPRFNNGERVALVRFPHAGPFEIPELTVNNKNLTAKRIIGKAEDAVGIHHSVAAKLSGADFDGDTVLVIPNDKGQVKSRPSLEGLKDFDPKSAYIGYQGMSHVMKKSNLQTEMGKISNLITDMNIRKAPDDEMARAARHAMVVIDAEKHGLNYKLSEQENGILSLKRKYQGGATKGASTIISKAGRDVTVPHQELRKARDGGPIDPKTGQLVWVDTGKTHAKSVTTTNPRTGEKSTTIVQVPSTIKRPEIHLTENRDSHKLSSGEPIESVYANHSNAMKALANEARKVSYDLRNTISKTKKSPAAAAHYVKEVASLNAKIKVAERNAPLERQAQTVGHAVARARIDSNPQLDKDDVKKIKFQSLTDARLQTGAAKIRIGSEASPITESEWHAIQANALAPTRLRSILANADMTRVRELATPRIRSSLTPGQISRAKSLESSGRSVSEIAAELGIPRSTLSENLKR